jgi:sugar phosphate isomerase/epimerase
MSNDEQDLKQARLVTVAQRPTEVAASILVSVLRDEGIKAVATGGFTAGFRAEAPGMVSVQTLETDAVRAKQIIAELRQEDEQGDQQGDRAVAQRLERTEVRMKSCITISLVEEARGGPFVLWDGLEESIDFAAELGYDAVEIFSPAPESLDIDSIGKRLESAGISLAALGTGAGWVKHRLQLADADPAHRKRARAFVRGTINAAGPLGASAIIGSMQGPSGHTGDAETARGYLCEALEDGGEQAARYDVPLIYEPLNRYETRQCCTVADGVRILESLSTDNVRLLCDLFHMNIEETSIADALIHGGKWVGHIHFVDSNRRPAGLGHLQFGPILDALRQINYAGYLCAEAFPYPNPQEAAKQTMRAFRYWTRCGT